MDSADCKLLFVWQRANEGGQKWLNALMQGTTGKPERQALWGR